MTTKPILSSSPSVYRAFVAALAAVVAFGVFAGVNALFQPDGAAMRSAVIAGGSCTDDADDSASVTCVDEHLVATPKLRVTRVTVVVRRLPAESVATSDIGW